MRVSSSRLATAVLFLFWCTWTYAQVAHAGSALENIIPFVALGIAAILAVRRRTRGMPKTSALVFLVYIYILLDSALRGAAPPGATPVVMSLVVTAASYFLIARAGRPDGLALGIGVGLLISVLADPNMASQLASAEANRQERFGGHLQVNAFAALLVVAAVTNALLLIFASGGRRYLAGILFVFCCLLAFLFVGSRQSMVAILLIFLALVVHLVRSKDVNKFYKYLTAFLACAAGYKLFVMMLDSEFGYRFLAAFDWFSGAARVSDHSLDDRQNLLGSAFQAFKNAPLFGHGLWGYGAYTGYGAYAHNNFAEVLVDHGLPGLFLLVMPYYFIVRNLLRVNSGTRDVIFGCLAAILVVEMANVTIGKPFFASVVVVVAWYSVTARTTLNQKPGV